MGAGNWETICTGLCCCWSGKDDTAGASDFTITSAGLSLFVPTSLVFTFALNPSLSAMYSTILTDPSSFRTSYDPVTAPFASEDSFLELLPPEAAAS